MKQLAISLGIVLASVILTLCAVEATLRLMGKEPPYAQHYEEVRRKTEGDGTRREVEDHRLPTKGLVVRTPAGKRLRPNTRGIIRNHFLSKKDVEIRTNALGYRGPELSETTRERVLFLGDSVTFGDYLDEQDTFVSLVSTMADRWETLNGGVGSIGVEDELAILRETGAAANPDLVVLDLYLNDVEPSPTLELVELPAGLEVSFLAQFVAHRLSLLRRQLRQQDDGDIPDSQWAEWRREFLEEHAIEEGDPLTNRLAFNRLISEAYQDWGAVWSAEVRRRILATVKEMREEAQSLGAEFAVVIFPTSYQVEAEFVVDEPQRHFREELESWGVPTLDLLPHLRKRFQDTGESQFYDHCHHTPAGSRATAEAIVEFLEGLG